jgi:hypothetical protein
LKGVVFRTFFRFCEERFGDVVLDDAIARAKLPHDGVYTSVGTYPFEEMVALVSAASAITRIPLPALLEDFGRFCFAAWVTELPHEFAGKDLFDVLQNVDDFHEREVRKLYPDAELPSFRTVARDQARLSMEYRSCKPLADLAAGVIRGAADHLSTPVRIERCPMRREDGTAVRFEVSKLG